MGFWDNILGRPMTSTFFRPQVTYIGADDLTAYVDGMSVADVWRSQPHVRTVVSFVARNIAQVGLHVYERNEDSRERDRTSPLARAIRNPGDGMTTYDLIFALVGDIALYDRAYWVLGVNEEGNPRIRRLPPSWVSPVRANPWTIKEYAVVWEDGGTATIPADRVLDFTGYAPAKHQTGSPAIEALKDTILEQMEAARYRKQTWKRGGRASAVLERPAAAPKWGDKAREAFREDWYAKYTGNGSMAGGTPILEDGMTLRRIDFNAKEQEYIEAGKLALSTTASAWHVNPTMVGLLDNANYSNVREFRRMLYGDTLGPYLTQIEDRINTFLIPMFALVNKTWAMDPDVAYAEFNVAEKLRASFEEQAAVLQTAIGRPWMTADEGRARTNMPALGGDAAELVTPLNVLVGGQASPTDAAPDSAPAGTSDGPLPAVRAVGGSKAHRAIGGRAVAAKATDAQREQVERVLKRFFARQGKSVGSALGAVGDDAGEWWEADRWNKELADDLHRVAHTVAAIVGTAMAENLGYDDGYDPDRTVKYLRAVAERWAGNINDTTKSRLDAAIEDPEADPADVFTEAETVRAAGAAVLVSTFVAGFGAVEAATQIAYDHGGEPTKTWHTGSNPRASHAAVDGQTVPIDEPFTNGSMWPADGPNVDEVAGCNCTVSIDF